MFRRLLATVSLLLAFCACTSSHRNVAYIPKDLDDAHQELTKMLPTEEIQHIRVMTNQDQMIEYHMGLGLAVGAAVGAVLTFTKSKSE